MRRLEYKDDKSHKFWELSVEGSAYTVRYGRVGTDGQMKTKGCASPEKAAAEGEKKLASKVKKGYVEVDAKAAAQAGPRRAGGPTNPALEAALFDKPDDRSAWQIYGDWLQREDDPHGELITLELQRSEASGAALRSITTRIAELTELHKKAWLGPAAKLLEDPNIDDAVRLTWEYGYVVQAEVGGPSDDSYEGPIPDKILRALVKAPAARFLRSLTIGTTYDDGDWRGVMDKNVQAITRAGKLEALTQLTVTDTNGYWDISSTVVGKVSDVLPVAPRLRTLYVRGNEIEIDQLVHDALETVTFETGGLPARSAQAISRCQLPNATRLVVYFGADDYGGDADVGHLRDLLAGEGLPKLEHLGLCNAEFQNDIARAVADSAILQRLRSLDLSMGTMTDEGARAIVAKAQAFRHLESLDLNDNFITQEACAELQTALPGVQLHLGSQEAPDEYNGELYTYVSVGE